jgi:hypothetical protein
VVRSLGEIERIKMEFEFKAKDAKSVSDYINNETLSHDNHFSKEGVLNYICDLLKKKINNEAIIGNYYVYDFAVPKNVIEEFSEVMRKAGFNVIINQYSNEYTATIGWE